MKTILRMTPLFVGALLVFWAGCDSNAMDDETFPDPVLTRVQDIPADPITSFDPVTGQPLAAGVFTFYSLRENRIVAREDSASTMWDLALKGTTILTNGGASGPGQGGVLVMEGLFEEITEAPTTGYTQDTVDSPAILGGSGNGWYNYNPQAMLLTPIPGRVLVIRAADGTFAKVRILSYYKGAPETPDVATDEARYYTFEFLHQPDGSRVLE